MSSRTIVAHAAAINAGELEPLDGENLDALRAIGWRLADRPDDFFTAIERELTNSAGEQLRAIHRAGGPDRRRQRKPTLASVAKQASKAALEVARYEVRPDGTVVVVTGKSEATQTSNPWLDDLKVTKQ